jgi:hypothetical protein
MTPFLKYSSSHSVASSCEAAMLVEVWVVVPGRRAVGLIFSRVLVSNCAVLMR